MAGRRRALEPEEVGCLMGGSLSNGRIWRRAQKRGAVFVGDWTTAEGKRCRKTLGSDRRVAQRMFADIIRRRDLCAAGLGIEEGFDLPADEIVQEFLGDLRSRRTPAYCDRVATMLRSVQQGMGVRTMRDFKPQAFLLHRRRRLEEDIANRTANMELTAARVFLNWAVRAGNIGFNPLQPVQPLPAGRGYERNPRRALSEEEIERFLAAAVELDEQAANRAAAAKTISGGTKGSVYTAKDRLRIVPQTPLWITLLETGARFGEATQAAWGDLSEVSGTLTLRAKTTKSRRERVLPIRRDLVEVLTELRLTHHEVRGRIPTAGDLIFLTPKGASWAGNRSNALKRFREILKLAGIPQVDERGEKVDIHSLRHSFASRLARNGVGMAQAQKLLGHSDPKLTMAIYTHLGTEDLRGAVESLPPLWVARG